MSDESTRRSMAAIRLTLFRWYGQVAYPANPTGAEYCANVGQNSSAEQNFVCEDGMVHFEARRNAVSGSACNRSVVNWMCDEGQSRISRS
jgi:hypothetical protein